MSVSLEDNLTGRSLGRLIGHALAHSWIESPPAFTRSEAELTAITELVIKSGAGALLWRRIRGTNLAETRSGTELHSVYRLHRLEALAHSHKIKKVLASLNDTGIEAVVMKGWSVARLYPEPGLRHYSDLDLCVAPREYRSVRRSLRALGALGSYVDLHSSLGRNDNLSWEELYARSEVVELDGLPVRVLGAEDHLRLLCLHWLRHGAWGPLGLCDIAVALAARPTTFDWQRSLGSDKKRAGWMVCALGLAHYLLSAEVDETPVANRARNLPGWLVPAVLEQWQTCVNPNYRDLALAEIQPFIGSPKTLYAQLATRWRHPIRATIEVRGSFNNWPRGPYQFAALMLRSSELPRQIALLLARKLRSIAQ